MSGAMKIRARMKDGITDVAVLMMHPMETGQRKDPRTGQTIPAHFIQKVTAAVNEKQVLVAQWGAAVSKNPLLGFRVEGATAGDKLVITWEDNLGEKSRAEATIA
ncbi:MAG TPA: thiosulfate oxidation carrier complex protein SoxZ [Rhodocyclaceae bacterium]|jgi:sulfur-oxidizing protein SoxZ|nr:thiosulfate oxidation carrier complex protein SoxZ [Rhodocyclaceae bacterium]HRQ45799.1 thiosulfate oxidation carrier complex protein SoxZ [Rhodocyclaceae bacterium]